MSSNQEIQEIYTNLLSAAKRSVTTGFDPKVLKGISSPEAVYYIIRRYYLESTSTVSSSNLYHYSSKQNDSGIKFESDALPDELKTILSLYCSKYSDFVLPLEN
jgi:hypothetical protein